MFQECLDFYIIKSMSDWMKKKKNRKSQLKEKWRKFDYGLINESVLESGSLWNVK